MSPWKTHKFWRELLLGATPSIVKVPTAKRAPSSPEKKEEESEKGGETYMGW